MRWKQTVDKLILEWLANRTPPECIRVNILSMAVAINPNSQVVTEIPCRKHIQNLWMVLSLVTKCLARKTLGECVRVQQAHSDGTSFKGTEILNLILSLWTRSNQLTTICLAGDIVHKDGSAECQSQALVAQFSETG